MPNRILRDWTDSDKINALSALAERFFTRLIMKADDFGCFYADTRLVKANLFPLLMDSIREADIARWMEECQKAGLIVLYEVSGKKYLEVLNFNQRLRLQKRKFPCRSNDGQMTVKCPPEDETKLKMKLEVESEVEVEPNQQQQSHEVFAKKFFSEVARLDRENIEMQLNPRRLLAENDLLEFNRHLMTEGKNHVHWSEYLKHLRNWMNKRPREPNGHKKEAVPKNEGTGRAGTILTVNELAKHGIGD